MNDKNQVVINIQNAYYDYYSKIGKRPTRLYVGMDELLVLQQNGFIFVTGEINNQNVQMEFLGVPIYEVCKQSHFYVC